MATLQFFNERQREQDRHLSDRPHFTAADSQDRHRHVGADWNPVCIFCAIAIFDTA
jgi:hypothetical protein